MEGILDEVWGEGGGRRGDRGEALVRVFCVQLLMADWRGWLHDVQ